MSPRVIPLFLIVLVAPPAAGVEFQLINPPPGSGQGGATITQMFQDEQAVTIEIDKWLLTSDQPVIIECTREPGDPEILEISDEIVLNVTGLDWIGYQIWATDAAGVQDSGFVSFIDPQLVTNYRQTGDIVRFEFLNTTSTLLDFVNDPLTEGVPSGTLFDAPNNQVVFRGIRIDMPGVGEPFRLYQWPIIPEPSGGLLLLTLSGWACGRCLRRGGRQPK
jgi:hypothetical protein